MDMTMLVCLVLVDYICHTLLLLRSKYGLANVNEYTDMRCEHVRSDAARIKTHKSHAGLDRWSWGCGGFQQQRPMNLCHAVNYVISSRLHVKDLSA